MKVRQTSMKNLTFYYVVLLLLLAYRSPVYSQEQLPPAFDWRDHGILTPVKHQLDCGSCGEFAAVAVLEALIKKESGVEVDLSEQQIVSCVDGCGCGSGCSSLQALKYIKENGVALESDFPYLNKDTCCISDLEASYFVTEVHSTTIARLPLEERIRTIKKTVQEYGPVATNMSLYDDLGRYQQGVYTYDLKSEAMGGHWVVIVGWQDDSDLASGGYWICRNSWGEKWGEGGYFKSAYGDVTGIDDFYIIYASYRQD